MSFKAHSYTTNTSATYKSKAYASFTSTKTKESVYKYNSVSVMRPPVQKMKMARVSLSDITSSISRKLDIEENKTKTVIQEALKEIQNSVLQGERVTFPGFGSFHRVVRTPRTMRNPQTGELFVSEPSATVKFVVGKAFKTSLNDVKEVAESSSEIASKADA